MAVASAAVGGGIGPGKAGPARIGITWALETKSLSQPLTAHGVRWGLGTRAFWQAPAGPLGRWRVTPREEEGLERERLGWSGDP